MNTVSVLSPSHSSTLFFFTASSSRTDPSPFLHHHQSLLRTLDFCFPKSLHAPSPSSLGFRAAYKSPGPLIPVKLELLEDQDDDDDEAADEYDEVISGDIELDDSEDEDEEEGVEGDDEVEEGEEEEEEVSGDGIEVEWSGDVESRYQRVEKLRSKVREFGREAIDVDELTSIYNFRIDKFQRLAMEAFLRGSSVVVSAPTSSGKTLIAEAAAMATFAKGRRLFYTTPLKALSNQKFHEFCETFGDGNVGLLTGDSVINKDAHVLIMTTEILRNMLYQSIGMASSRGGLSHVDVIILDEVHYLSDISRGTVWEEIVIYCPKEVQLICLSATVANPEELAGWIDQIHGKTELVTSSRRPVPLTWHFSTKANLVPLLDEKGKRMNRRLSLNYLQLNRSKFRNFKDDRSRRRNSRKRGTDFSYDNSGSALELSKNDVNAIRRSQIPQVVDTLRQLEDRDMLPAIWFIFSRQGCDAAVQYLEYCELLDEREMSEVDSALKKFQLQYPDAVRETAVKGLLRGAAAHHAGCLPLWKSFIEDLFQQGLVKVVFATETLAAGINMPARTAVISSLSKRTDNGRRLLNPNELLQMAGRAGRRGIDTKGHVVLLQSLYEGAEEACKVLFSGIEPLVSQFTASYGMVLNLLAGARVTRQPNDADENPKQAGRTLEEARKLVEQSFGNYVGSNVMLAAKEELGKIEKEIESLTYEISDEAIDKMSKNALSPTAYERIIALQEELRSEKRRRIELREKTMLMRLSCLKPILEELEKESLPFLSLQYKDSEGTHHIVSAVYLGKVDSLHSTKLKTLITTDDSFAINPIKWPVTEVPETHESVQPAYHVALGSDNNWYLFTEKWIRTVYKTGLPDVALAEGGPLPRETMSTLLDQEELQWEKLSVSDSGGLWNTEGSLETWSWSLNVPVLSSLSETDEAQLSQPFLDALETYKDYKRKVARLKKKISRAEGFKEYKNILVMAKVKEEKITRLQARAIRLTNRIEQIEPSGWKEFMQISNVIHETRALAADTNVIFPLGETAAAIRGENELWLAMVLRNKVLLNLKPPQLAAVCGSIVSEGIKVRPWKNNNFIYEASPTALSVISSLEDQRTSFMELQEKHEVNIPCCLDSQFAGMVEAWASGLTWKELMVDCAMDEGDVARLLRRTIDLLAQIPKLPDIDPLLQRNALAAYNVMDRPPISELAG